MFNFLKRLSGNKNEEKKFEIKKIEYETYLSHRKYLINEKHKMANKESGLLIYLSAGVLSFSVAFTKKIVANFVFIIISWELAISSFILILLSFFYSKISFEEEIIIQDIKYENGNKKEKKKKEVPKNSKIKLIINSIFWARLFLIFSIIILFLFYSINLFTNV